MSAHPGEPEPFKRPRWVIPVALIGMLVLVLGLVLGVGLTSDTGKKPVTITSTTLG